MYNYNQVFFGLDFQKEILDDILKKRKRTKSMIFTKRLCFDKVLSQGNDNVCLDNEEEEMFLGRSYDTAMKILKRKIEKPIRKTNKKRLKSMINNQKDLKHKTLGKRPN